ncbi:MAG: hypothetical protein KC546_21940, partial [Anaerolineae bacterium]|nr:hypothetical protein [Anaerolineae bacterium]
MKKRFFTYLAVLLILAFGLIPAIYAQSTAEEAGGNGVATSAPDYSHPQVEVLVEGLRNPGEMALLPDGSLLVAENGTFNDDFSAGISMVTADGQIGRIVSGMPSIDRDYEQIGSAFIAFDAESNTLTGLFDDVGMWVLAQPADGFS